VTPCAFCDIAVGRAPAEVVHTDADVVGFVPPEPFVPGHVLFAPRRHVADAQVATYSGADRAASAAAYLAASSWLAQTGSVGNLLTSCGAGATQTVPHLHVHVLPRGGGDGLPADWPWLRDGADAWRWLGRRLIGA